MILWGRGKGWKHSGVGGEGVGNILVIKTTKKGVGGGLGFKALLGGGGSLFLEFPSLLDSLVVCMCCCNPFPYPPPPCFFDVYKSRQ